MTALVFLYIISNKNYNRGQKGVAGSTSNSTKAFSKQRDLLGGGSSGLVGAYATLAANIFAATALFGALQRAAQIEQLSRGLVELGKASGLSLGTLSNGLRQAIVEILSCLPLGPKFVRLKSCVFK